MSKQGDFVGEPYRDFRGNLVRVRKNGSREVLVTFDGDPGKTVQSHTDECSIEKILAKYVASNVPIQLTETEFQDFTALPDYHDCLNVVHEIQDLFMQLDAPIRSEFKHDPGLFMQALGDPTMKDRLIALGVLKAATADDMVGNTGNVSTPPSTEDGKSA